MSVFIFLMKAKIKIIKSVVNERVIRYVKGYLGRSPGKSRGNSKFI